MRVVCYSVISSCSCLPVVLIVMSPFFTSNDCPFLHASMKAGTCPINAKPPSILPAVKTDGDISPIGGQRMPAKKSITVAISVTQKHAVVWLLLIICEPF